MQEETTATYYEYNQDNALELLALNDAIKPYKCINVKELLKWNEYMDITYHPYTGRFFKFKISKTEFHPCGLPVVLLFEVWYSDVYQFSVKKKSTNKYTFKNANYLAWEIINQRFVPEGCCVYMKDLNQSNLVQNNLGVADRKDYKKLRDAIKNRNGVLKLSQQVNMRFKVRYREDCSIKAKRFFDESEAKEFYKSIQLRDAKLLSQFHVSE